MSKQALGRGGKEERGVRGSVGGGSHYRDSEARLRGLAVLQRKRGELPTREVSPCIEERKKNSLSGQITPREEKLNYE